MAAIRLLPTPAPAPATSTAAAAAAAACSSTTATTTTTNNNNNTNNTNRVACCVNIAALIADRNNHTGSTGIACTCTARLS